MGRFLLSAWTFTALLLLSCTSADQKRPVSPNLAADSALLGAWFTRLNPDVVAKVVYLENGRGEYFRNDSLCFEFSYDVRGAIVTERADKENPCRFPTENAYELVASANTLARKHLPSGMSSTWYRTLPPQSVAEQQADPRNDRPAISKQGLLGAWFSRLNRQVVVKEILLEDGRGQYFRNDELCFEFSYELHGSVVTEKADKENPCRFPTENAYELLLSADALERKHVGSGITATWYRTPPPQPPRKREPNHLCWISWVEKTESGVSIYFSNGRSVARRDQPTRWIEADPVPAALNDEIFVAAGAHDTCVVRVVVRDGKIGVDASAHSHPPGLPAMSNKEFVAAED